MELDFMDSLGKLVARVRQAQAEGLSRADAVEGVIGRASARVVRGLAALYLAEEVARLDRAAALAVERQAERDAEPAAENSGPISYMGRAKPRRYSKRWQEWVQTDEGREYEAQREADEAASSRMLFEALDKTLKDYEKAMKMKWTAELLGTEFALPDGTAVTWGEATVEDHEARQQMFMRNAHGNLEGAARHSQAINDLRAGNVSTLNDLVGAHV